MQVTSLHISWKGQKMLKLILGIVLGALFVVIGVYLYFAMGRAPVAVTAPPIPF